MNILPIHLYKEYTEIDPSIYDFIDDNKKKVEYSLVMHNNMNILSSIWGYTYLILNNKTLIENSIPALDGLKKDVSKGKKPDFAPLLGLIRMNYKDTNLHGNKYFKKIIKAIELLDEKINKKENEYNALKINFEDIEHSILNNISTLKGGYNISKIHKINNGYYINFNFSSHLGVDFHITPILITLIIDLLHNSVKYSNIGTQIDININQTIECINISVSDEGTGIEEKDIEKIFEYGIRLDNVGSEEGNGIGGAKLINEVEKLGGKLYIKSKTGIGTEVLFTIPNKT